MAREKGYLPQVFTIQPQEIKGKESGVLWSLHQCRKDRPTEMVRRDELTIGDGMVGADLVDDGFTQMPEAREPMLFSGKELALRLCVR